MALRRRALFLVATAASVSLLATPAGARSCWRMSGKEHRLVDLTNEERAGHGLPRLVIDPHLSKVATVHADEMADAGGVYHSTLGTLERRVTNWKVLGENVGVGRTLNAVHDRFMKSRTHRRNILASDFFRIGIGSEQRRGRLWVTVMFAKRRDPGTRLAMENC